jgi:hypothetical protein
MMADDPKKVEELEPQPAPEVEVPDPAATPELSPRARAEKEVWAAANERRAREAAEPLPPGAGDVPVAPAPPGTPEPEPEPVEAGGEPKGEVSAPEVAAEDPEIELLVNGKPMKVKQSQILDAGRRTLQKDAAADMKLEIASKLLREAEERVGKQPPSQEGAQPPADPSKQPVQGKGDAELAELLQYGTKEQAAAAIAEIRRRDNGADPQQGLSEFIAKQLPAALDARLAFHEAVRTARSDYKEIFADPHLTTLFHVQEHRAREAGDARSHAELYKEIGDGIRKHFKLAPPTPPANQTLEQKKDAKRAMPLLPRPAGSRVESAGAEKPLTPEQARERALDAMKKSRGQHDSLKKY